jgi:hypothetical protein
MFGCLKRFSDHDFSAGIVGLAMARHLKLFHSDGTYQLVRQEGGQPATDLESWFEDVLFRADNELSISATNGNSVVAARAALDKFVRDAVLPALLHKEPRNVHPARAIATIVLTVAALAIEYGAFALALAIVIGLSVVGALLLATAALVRGHWAIAVIGLPLLSLGLWGACRRRPIAIPRRPVPAATAALARASSCPPADSADGRGWKRRDEIEGLKEPLIYSPFLSIL